jgi:hypothetical protein
MGRVAVVVVVGEFGEQGGNAWQPRLMLGNKKS